MDANASPDGNSLDRNDVNHNRIPL